MHLPTNTWMDIRNFTAQKLSGQVQLFQTMAADTHLHQQLELAIKAVVNALQMEKKIWFCGNGGSAADAQHLAAELSGRFYKNRPALNAEALHCNTSYLTAVANDYGYEHVYARIMEGVGRAGDVLIAFSTSGNSPNIQFAIEAAEKQGIFVIGFSGADGGKMKEKCNVMIHIPSTDTPRIQEGYMHLGHLLCEMVESTLFPI